jgi:predicted dehydrogenase
VALGRHRQMAGIAHDLLDQGYPFLMEKPMGINAPEVEAVAAKAARLDAFVAVPLAQRYAPFATRARELLAVGRFGPLSHIYVRLNRPGPDRRATKPGIALGCSIPRPAAAASATWGRTGYTKSH